MWRSATRVGLPRRPPRSPCGLRASAPSVLQGHGQMQVRDWRRGMHSGRCLCGLCRPQVSAAVSVGDRMTHSKLRSMQQCSFSTPQRARDGEEGPESEAAEVESSGAGGEVTDEAPVEEEEGSGFVETESGLFVRDVIIGHGRTPSVGEKVTIHYSVFEAEEVRPLESTWKTGFPFMFWVGDGRALKGVDEGVRGMRVGGRRELILPPELGFGRRSQPPNMTLFIEVDMLRIGDEGPFRRFIRRWFGSPEGDTEEGEGMTPPIPRKSKGE